MQTIYGTVWRTCVFFSIFLMATPAWAQGMPWEGPLSKILSSLTGPVAKVLGSIAIVLLGFGVAFSEGGSVLRKALWVILGLVIAFNAVSWGITFLGYGADGGGGA
jgi:type IV secretion system protein VirB2